jgi:hypothetical protein
MRMAQAQQQQTPQSTQTQQQQQTQQSPPQQPNVPPYTTDDDLTGSSSHLSAHSREFVPVSQPVHDQSDDTMRSVLLRQEMAAKILRMQSGQLQPTNTSGPVNASVPASASSDLRAENAQLQERCRGYEREQQQLKLRLLEKEARLKQVQWNLDQVSEEKRRLAAQLETLHKFLGGLNPAPQQEAHRQPPSHHAPLSHHHNHGGGVHESHQLYRGDTAAAEIAESVLISPHDEDKGMNLRADAAKGAADTHSPRLASAHELPSP